jgi:NADPH-dependent 7-cyano-7-deazaguanine reductase QueF
VTLLAPDMFDREPVHELDGLDLDRLDIECTHYQPAPELLSSDTTQVHVNETLTSRLLKSNCLVTGQPDWGSVQIRYSGPPIDQAGLLAYIVSFRNHNEFHEPCAERMFTDIWNRCKPTKLAVYARYTRRGGLDINPFRTSWPQALPEHPDGASVAHVRRPEVAAPVRHRGRPRQHQRRRQALPHCAGRRQQAHLRPRGPRPAAAAGAACARRHGSPRRGTACCCTRARCSRPWTGWAPSSTTSRTAWPAW